MVGGIGQLLEAGGYRRHLPVALPVGLDQRWSLLRRDLDGGELFDPTVLNQPAAAGGVQVARPVGAAARGQQVALAGIFEDDDRVVRHCPLRRPGTDSRATMVRFMTGARRLPMVR